MAGDPVNGGALPLHIALEKDHEDVVVWYSMPQLERANPRQPACSLNLRALSLSLMGSN